MGTEKKLGLRGRLLVVALLAAIPGFAVLGWYIFSEWEHAVEAEQLRSKVVADEVTRDLWGIFRDFREVVAEIARRPQIASLDKSTCSSVLREYAAVHKEIAALTVRDLTGQVVCSSLSSPVVILPERQMHILTETAASGLFSISGVERGPSSEKWVTALTYPVGKTAMGPAAVIFLTLDLTEYSARILSDIPYGTLVTVLDRTGRVTMRSSGLAALIGKPSRDADRSSFPKASEGIASRRAADGEDHMLAYVTEPFSGWVVVSDVDADTALAPHRAQILWFTGGSILISILFIWALVRTARGVAQPLLKLAGVVRAVAEGDTLARAPETAIPEVSAVSTQFNHMLDVIEDQKRRAKAAADHVEALAMRLMRLEEIGAAGGFEFDFETRDSSLTPGSCQILDLDPDDGAGIRSYMNSSRFLTPKLEEAMREASQTSRPWSVDVQIETAAGRKRWLATRGEIEIRDGRSVGIVGHIRDITERKEAENRSATFAAIVESSEDAIIARNASGIVTAWNAGATKLFGYGSEEMIGASIDRIIPFDMRHEEEFILGNIVEGRTLDHYETVRLTKSGGRIDVSLSISPIRDSEGKVVGEAKIARDISQRKRNEMRLHAIVDASPVPYVISDRYGNLVNVNRAFTQTFSYEIDEIRAPEQWREKLFSDAAQRMEFEKILAAHTEAANNGQFAPPQEITLVAGDRSSRKILIAISRLSELEADDVIVCVQDVTELRKAQDQLRDSQKMEAFGRLASGIAHDFNNLLGIITSSAEVVRDQEARQQDTRRSTELILRACERGSDLTRRLLIFSRKSNPRPQSLNVIQIVDELIEVLHRTLGSHVTVTSSVLCTDAYISADATLFQTALYNLALNARDAMPGGGNLEFVVSRTQAKAPAIGEDVCIAISDTGGGMAADIASKIFEPFFTTKDAGKGTGLGLSMVYGFVKEAGGDIQLRSAPGQGTTFTLSFPASASPPKPLERDERPGEVHLKRRKILLVEDDADLRDATMLQVRSLGLSVEAVSSTREALALVEATPDFDVLLTDFRLSEAANGADLARDLEAKLPDLKVVVMSGYLTADQARAIDRRWTLLEKPVTKLDLKKTLADG